MSHGTHFWRHQYQNGKIWLNGDWIAVNSPERVLSIIINIFQMSILCPKNVLFVKRKLVIIVKHLLWRRWFPLQFGVVLVLSFEYHTQSIKAYHWSNKHSKCQIWSISDIFKIDDVMRWRHNYAKSISLYIILAVSPRHACGRFEQKTAFMNLVRLT